MPTNRYGQEVGDPVDGWTAREAPSRTPTQGRLARVEALSAERHATDLFDVYAEAADARDWTYLTSDRPEDRHSFCQHLSVLASSTDAFHYALVDCATGRARGTAALMRVDRPNGVIELGAITFSPRLKNTAMGTEAIFLLMSRVFDEHGYRRLEWKCDALNAASRRAAERYGFAFEGIFRQAVVTKGRSRDTAWYALLDRDWPAVRDTISAWLQPSNFDGAGRQHKALSAFRASSSLASGKKR
jgi:RimJ/RimL family protein N-acetyltransferase